MMCVGIKLGVVSTAQKKRNFYIWEGLYKYNFLCDRMYVFMVTCGHPIQLTLFLWAEVMKKGVTT